MDIFTKIKEEMNAKRYATMTPEEIIWDKFAGLLNDLSPENISCDGEASMAQIKKQRARIIKEWGNLERELGRTVTEDEAYSQAFKSMRSNARKVI
jgi:hypothetical protein